MIIRFAGFQGANQAIELDKFKVVQDITKA